MTSNYDKAVELVRNGMTYRDAAKETGCKSLSGIYRHCMKAGVKRRGVGKPLGAGMSEATKRAMRMVIGGSTYKAAALANGISAGGLHDAMTRRNNHPRREVVVTRIPEQPNDKRNKAVMELREIGFSYGEIAGAMDMSRSAVAGVIDRHKQKEGV